MPTSIKNASFKMPLLCFSCFNSLFASDFLKIVVPAPAGSTILQNDAKQNALKNVSFEPLLAALALSIPLRRALFRH